MKLAIMQPYFFPYIGYFQLMNAVDEFVIYDNIEYSKKGWVNRNRVLVNGTDAYITLPLKKDSDYLNIRNRYLAETWPVERKKMLNRITESYRKAPHYDSAYPVIENAILYNESNLFKFIFNSLSLVREYLEIKTAFIISSTIEADHALKAENKVIEICKAKKADVYINSIGGLELYSKADFQNNGIKLNFIKSKAEEYSQFKDKFVPWLSIIDVMMFNAREDIISMLDNCELV